MLICCATISPTIKPLHAVIAFPLLSTTCAHACCFILHLHNPTAAQMDVVTISLVNSMSSRRSLLQLAACGGCPCLLFRC
jgi:hypothetical protein